LYASNLTSDKHLTCQKSKLKTAINEVISWLNGWQEAKEEYTLCGMMKQRTMQR
jgi:hypothetical protein